MTKHIHRQIVLLKQKILDVGTMVEESITKSLSALVNRDAAMAERIISDDDLIDHLEVDVEEDCLKILALYQPVATDLRFVVAALKINNDLERMGDIAKNIAKRASWLARNEPFNLPIDFRQMAMQSQQMVRQCLDAFVNADPGLARQVRSEDDVVDLWRERIRDQILSEIQQRPERVEHLLKLNAISKHLERLADMATNVAEDVIYMVEGEIVRHQSFDE